MSSGPELGLQREIIMADNGFNWPKKGDRAFGPSVSSADRARLEAFVMPSNGSYVVGFKRAADMILATAQGDEQNPDDLFFPVAYLYRHHLELMLKELVRLGAQIGAIETTAACPPQACPCCGHAPKAHKNPLLGHNLHKLWNNAKQLIKAVWPDSPDDDLNAVEQMILEFHRLDPTGQAFRYARDKHGQQHLAGAPQHIDLGGLHAAVDSVSVFLDAAYAGIEHGDPGPH